MLLYEEISWNIHSFQGTEKASVNQSIPEKNRGFKMLQSMGWSKGQGLGREQGGIVDPLSVIFWV